MAADDADISRWFSENMLPWIAQILLAGVGVLAYWGISAKIEDAASDVCGCKSLIKANAQHIRRLIQHTDEVETNGNLPLDLDGSSSGLRRVDSPADWIDRSQNGDPWHYRRYCDLDTRAKFEQGRRHGG